MRYFETRSNAFRSGAGVFALHLVLELVLLYFVVRLLFAQVTNIDPRLEREVMSMLPVVLLMTALVFVIAWLVVGAIMHYGSGGGKTDGTFADALGVAGWAYAPEIVLFLPALAYTWREIQQFSFDGSDPQQLAAEFEAIAAQAELAIVPILLLVVTTVWSVYILAHGVSETHDVSLETAATPAVIVGLGSVVLWFLA